MHLSWRRWGLVLILLLCEPHLVRADEVQLLNGDRLTGEVVKMEGGTLTFKTAYGGALSIDWKQVQHLTSEKPLSIQMDPEAIGPTRADIFTFILGDPERRAVRALGVGEEVPTGTVKSINVPHLRYHGNVAAGGNKTSGNTDTAAFNGSTRWTIRSDRHRVLLEGKYNYAEVGSQVTARNSMASVKYDFFLSKKTFVNSEELIEKDTLQNLFLRSTTSTGIGYQFVDTERHKLAGVLGAGYVYEEFTTVPVTQTPTTRWGLRWEYALIPKVVNLFHKHEGYRDIVVRNAFRLNADQGIRVTLYENLFLNVEYDLRYNTDPAPGKLTTDEAFIVGVGYDFTN